MFKNQNILITGGRGFLGSYLTRKLLTCNANSIVIPTTNVRNKTSLDILKVNSNKINIVKGDIRDFGFLELLFNEYEFDIVAHLASISEVRKCQKDAELAFDINIMGTINLLEISKLYKNIKAIIVASSDKAYGSGNLPYKEDQTLQGKGVYEVSKSCVDMIAQAYAENYDMPVVVTRCCNLYGGGDLNFSRIIPNTIRQLLRNESPLIWKGSEFAKREFLYVDDAVNAYISLIKNINMTKGKAYNIGSGNIISMVDLVDLIIAKFGTNIMPEYKIKNFPEIVDQYLDSKKIKEEIGWEATIDIDDGLSATIDFYKLILKEIL